LPHAAEDERLIVLEGKMAVEIGGEPSIRRLATSCLSVGAVHRHDNRADRGYQHP